MKYYLNRETEEISSLEELYNGLHFEILNNLNSDEEFPTLEQFEKDLDCAIYQGTCEFIQLENIFKLDCFNLPMIVYDELIEMLVFIKLCKNPFAKWWEVKSSLSDTEIAQFYKSHKWSIKQFRCLRKYYWGEVKQNDKNKQYSRF